MGYRTAGQVLEKELASLHRRLELVRRERERLTAQGHCGPLRLEAFENQIDEMVAQIHRLEDMLHTKSEELSARHRSDFNSKGWV
jgi:hypothetical protein